MNKRDTLLQNRDLVARLYLVDRLTTREIGKRFGVSKHPVLDAMHEMGISLRSTRTRGNKPSCDQLRRWVLDDRLSLSDIAKTTGAHYTGIRYWIKNCGINWDAGNWTQRNRRRGLVEPTRKELLQWYNEQHFSLSQIAHKLGASRAYVKRRFEKYGISIRHPGWTGHRFTCDDGHVVKSSYELRVDNWLFSYGVAHQYEPALNGLGGTSSADFLVGATYIEVWGVMDSARYKRRRQKKIEWYHRSGLNLLSINYWDFAAQKRDLWKRKLQSAFL